MTTFSPSQDRADTWAEGSFHGPGVPPLPSDPELPERPPPEEPPIPIDPDPYPKYEDEPPPRPID